jgi:outer membrane protein OmpA-like peptidoglycan-associated protein/HEPN domain-containing protein
MKNKLKIISILFLLPFIFSTILTAQNKRDVVFKKVNEIKRKAEINGAAILSPISYEKAAEFYKDAEELFIKGITGGSLEAKINAATDHFQKAFNFSEAGKLKLNEGIEARNNAVNTEAATHASNIWYKAEKKFNDAAEQLELGNIEDAVELSREAANLYRQAELISLKTNYLEDTYMLIEKAERMDADEYSPRTLKKAKSLAEFAEKEISLNRYDSKRAKELSLEALYEANHAIFLTNLIKRIKKDNVTIEELLLEIEEPFNAIGGALNTKANISKGYQYVKTQLLNRIDSLKKNVSDLQNENTLLVRKINLLDSEVGVEEAKPNSLRSKIATESSIRENYFEVQKLFKQSEAEVFKEGNVITLRLVGLLFDPASSELKDFHFVLLKKVIEAIKKFSDAKVRVEGHTDSSGDSIMNLRLSEERAYSVMNYIKTNAKFKINKLTASGYGETNPIASNGTRAGRAMNKRIDVVIMP